MTDKILVVCAHSDDQILGPGGTLAKYAKQGKKIKTIIVSYGESSHPHLKNEVTMKIRSNEAIEADNIIGGNGVNFIGIKEGSFLKNQSTIKKSILNFLNNYKPNKIFTHSDEDPHPDHRAVTKILLSQMDALDYDADVYMFDVWNIFRIRKRDLPKMYEDISSTFSIKLKALKCFSSQWLTMIFLLWTIYLRAIKNGFVVRKRFAERFYKIR